jgi:outer membrane lipoprotein-sorting protein
MIKYILTIVLFINSIFNLDAQKTPDSEELINRFIQSIQSSAIHSGFSITSTEKNALNSQRFSGKLLLKGNQFYLEMEDMLVWFNGKTQWVYLKQSNEVSITEPSEEEIAEVNPVAVLTAFKAKSNLRKANSSNPQNVKIEMTPRKKGESFSKVEAEFVKSGGNLSLIRIHYTNGSKHEIQLNNYRLQSQIPAGSFVFDKSRFKNVIINDLR